MMPQPALSQTGNCLPSGISTIVAVRRRVQILFGKRLCLWQYRVPEAIWQGKHVVLNVGTGQGKTLAFYTQALVAPGKTQIIVTALNVLAAQNVAQLRAAGISAIAIIGDDATPENFKVCPIAISQGSRNDAPQDIAAGKYAVVITSPEQTMKPGGGFEKLFSSPEFRARLTCVIFDEAHCISQWGSFRAEYTEISRLRHQLPCIPMVFASATFSPLILSDIKMQFDLTAENTLYIQRPNDRPNVHITVRTIERAISSYADLAFLIPEGDNIPQKFLIFFDSINECVAAGSSLRHRLPPELRDKISWFHSEMSDQHKKDELERLRKGEIWGLCATDSFRLVMSSSIFASLCSH